MKTPRESVPGNVRRKPSPAGEKAPTLLSGIRYLLNGVIVVLAVAVGYFAYAMYSRQAGGEPLRVNTEQAAAQNSGQQSATVTAERNGKALQIDVLNGCGSKGAATTTMNLLRSRGFDVVSVQNYKTSRVPETLVIDRVGNLASARRVASALGVAEKNIVQQLNPDYFVDVSVVIGKDYIDLHASSGQ
jgi:hypothetical protein